MSSASLAVWKQEEVQEKGQLWGKTVEDLDGEDTVLTNALEAAAEMVGDQGDEDEPTFSAAALDRAGEFLRLQAHEMKKRFHFWPTVPVISPGPGGSVDLNWKQPGCGLLVNIPATGAYATFYGEQQDAARVKGSFDPKSWNLVILTWLSKQ